MACLDVFQVNQHLSQIWTPWSTEAISNPNLDMKNWNLSHIWKCFLLKFHLRLVLQPKYLWQITIFWSHFCSISHWRCHRTKISHITCSEKHFYSFRLHNQDWHLLQWRSDHYDFFVRTQTANQLQKLLYSGLSDVRDDLTIDGLISEVASLSHTSSGKLQSFSFCSWPSFYTWTKDSQFHILRTL